MTHHGITQRGIPQQTGPAAPGVTHAEPGAPRALRALQFALAAIFVVVGAATLAGTPDVLAQFGTIANATGVGAWIRIAVGLLEVLGGVFLCVRPTASVGAVLLGVVMIGAALADVLVLQSAPTVAIALFAALAVVAHAERATLAVVAAQLERNL